MPYIRFTADPRLGNGDFEECVYHEDTGAGVGIREELHDGDTEITEQEYDTEKSAILAANAAIPAPEPPALPDVSGFEKATLAAFDPMRGLEIYAKYGLFMRMLDKQDWSGARGLLGAVTAAGGITQDEYAIIAKLLDENHIP